MSGGEHNNNISDQDAVPAHAASPFTDDVDQISPVRQQSPSDDRSDAARDASSSAEDQLMSRSVKKNDKDPDIPAKSFLRYRRTSAWLLACYLPFLILPWILTNVLADRPPSLPSYYIQRYEHCESRTNTILFWFVFVRILNSIASVLVVPITSALLAHGAVVYTQRRNHRQKLHLRQLFALSDRNWSDVPTLWHAWRNRGRAGGMTSEYLKLATCVLLLSVIVAQQALIHYEPSAIMTCADHPFSGPLIVGFDPEPQALSVIPQSMVIPDIIGSISVVSDLDQQAYLYHDIPANWSEFQYPGIDNYVGGTFSAPYLYDPGLRFYVTAFPNSTNTGILREHIIRLNSTAECSTIQDSAFPEPCDGPNSLTPSYDAGGVKIDICVPGNMSASLWSLSRDLNFTVHCTASTTRGYFELPNWTNDFNAGPLLNTWPDKKTLKDEFNDYLSQGFGFAGHVPSTEDTFSTSDFGQIGNWRWPPEPWTIQYDQMPGPLAASAIAMFGKGSFFHIASRGSNSSNPSALQQICQAGNIPFLRLIDMAMEVYQDVFNACSFINDPSERKYDSSELGRVLSAWIAPFNPANRNIQGLMYSPATSYSKEMLEVSMYFANLHWLLETQAATGLAFSARNIWSSPGLGIARPVVPLAAKIIVSLLIASQLVALGLLMRYIYSVPTWTAALDSSAVAQLTRNVDSDAFAMIRKLDEADLRELTNCSGLVGVAEDNEKKTADSPPDAQQASAEVEALQTSRAHPDAEDANDESGLVEAVHAEPVLVRGGPGLITKQHATFENSGWRPEPTTWWPRLKQRKITKDSRLEQGPFIDPARRARAARAK